jgi:uncharacterized membrane protein
VKRRTTRSPSSSSDFKVATTKRKPFPARTGIQRASETEQVPSAILRELEDLRLRVRTLNAINTNLRRQVHKLSSQLKVSPQLDAAEREPAKSVVEHTKQ